MGLHKPGGHEYAMGRVVRTVYECFALLMEGEFSMWDETEEGYKIAMKNTEKCRIIYCLLGSKQKPKEMEEIIAGIKYKIREFKTIKDKSDNINDGAVEIVNDLQSMKLD